MPNTTFRGKVYPLTPSHPEADRYPWLDDDELQAMADDIRATKQREPISLLPDGRILDGRNRELACYVAGKMPEYVVADIGEDEVAAFVLSANYHRRHMTAEQKRAVIADALRKTPEQSNSGIAKKLKVSDKTVAKQRAKMEATSEIPKLNETTGLDGKTRKVKPARDPKPKSADVPKPTSDYPKLNTTATGDEPSENCSREQNQPTTPVEPVNPFADLMSRVTALASELTRAVNRDDESGKKLKEVMTACGLLEYPKEVGGKPRFLPLAGVHALLDLASGPGALPDTANVLLVYDRANGSWVPPLTRRRRTLKQHRKAVSR